ncbi:uncharacterized protein [Temnothorax longispinosus]|uniref:uncharacterized protein n=1 Tax=Temnothorax longispinosus TaxID=300112 RepID=UPI003A99C002
MNSSSSSSRDSGIDLFGKYDDYVASSDYTNDSDGPAFLKEPSIAEQAARLAALAEVATQAARAREDGRAYFAAQRAAQAALEKEESITLERSVSSMDSDEIFTSPESRKDYEKRKEMRKQKKKKKKEEEKEEEEEEEEEDPDDPRPGSSSAKIRRQVSRVYTPRMADRDSSSSSSSSSSSDGNESDYDSGNEWAVPIHLSRRQEYWIRRRDAELHAIVVRKGGGAAASLASKQFMRNWKTPNSPPSDSDIDNLTVRPRGCFNTHLDLKSWQPDKEKHFRVRADFFRNISADIMSRSANEKDVWEASESILYSIRLQMDEEEEEEREEKEKSIRREEKEEQEEEEDEDEEDEYEDPHDPQPGPSSAKIRRLPLKGKNNREGRTLFQRRGSKSRQESPSCVPLNGINDERNVFVGDVVGETVQENLQRSFGRLDERPACYEKQQIFGRAFTMVTRPVTRRRYLSEDICMLRPGLAVITATSGQSCTISM